MEADEIIIQRTIQDIYRRKKDYDDAGYFPTWASKLIMLIACSLPALFAYEKAMGYFYFKVSYWWLIYDLLLLWYYSIIAWRIASWQVTGSVINPTFVDRVKGALHDPIKQKCEDGYICATNFFLIYPNRFPPDIESRVRSLINDKRLDKTKSEDEQCQRLGNLLFTDFVMGFKDEVFLY
jgi:hypothetical protein